MAISTVNQKGLDAPLTLTSPVLTTPNLGTPSALVLTNATGLPSSALPAGCVVQLVNTSTSSNISTTSATDVSTGVSLSISPKFSTSKIIAYMFGGGLDYGGGVSGNALQVSIYRNGSKVVSIAGGTYGNPYALGLAGACIDSPATTASTTYTIYISSTGGITGYLLNSGSSITRPLMFMLMEVAA